MAAILVVEDDERIAQELFSIFFGKGHLVAVARPNTKPTILQQAFADLVVFDVDKWVEGNAVRHLLLAETSARPPRLFLTHSTSLLSSASCYNPTWDDYVTKPLDVSEVEARAEALLGRCRKLRDEGARVLLTAGPVRLDVKKAEVRVNGHLIPLTSMEFHLLRYLVSNAGEVVSGERLLRDIWGYSNVRGPMDLVRTHIKNLRAKIGFFDIDPFRVVQTIPRRGYVVRRNAEWQTSA